MATVTQITHLGEPGLRLAADELEAVVIPKAGMVVASLRHGGQELLGRTDLLAGWIDGGHTMGIPLLHPWANRIASERYAIEGEEVEIDPASPLVHRDGNGLPIHGLLHASPHWKDVFHHASTAHARLTAALDAADVPGMLDAFPFPHRLELTYELAPGALRIETALTPTSARAVPIAFGWHPYFRPGEEPREAWGLQLPQMAMLELDAQMLPTGLSHPFEELEQALADTAYDDAFAGVEPGSELAIGATARRIAVSFDEGYRYAQVFAPLDQQVVALEPMTAPGNALVSEDGLFYAQPGTTHRAVFTVHVR
jgi:galactose mutarotase-like enzyme